MCYRWWDGERGWFDSVCTVWVLGEGAVNPPHQYLTGLSLGWSVLKDKCFCSGSLQKCWMLSLETHPPDVKITFFLSQS